MGRKRVLTIVSFRVVWCDPWQTPLVTGSCVHCGRSRMKEAIVRFLTRNQKDDIGICKQFLVGCVAPLGRPSGT